MKELHFDPLETELGDVDVIEGITGQTFNEFIGKPSPGGKGMKAIYYLVMRQNDPEFSVEMLAKVKLRDLEAVNRAFELLRANPTAAGESKR